MLFKYIKYTTISLSSNMLYVAHLHFKMKKNKGKGNMNEEYPMIPLVPNLDKTFVIETQFKVV